MAKYLKNNHGCTRANEFLLYQLMLAIREMHGKGIMHRDLKPGNLLLQKICKEDEFHWLKIADFGLARNLRDDENILNE